MADNISLISGYQSYFNELVAIASSQEIAKPLGDAVRKHALTFEQVWNPTDFQTFGDTYVRNYIGKDELSKWEALVMNWKKGNQTSIHGHPQLASYTILSGELLIETYVITEEGCKKRSEYTCKPGDSFFAIGSADAFDNHVHRLTCLSDFAHSLHIYSDDARLGATFTSTM